VERTSFLLAAILCCTLTFGIVSPPAYASSWEPETADASDNTGFWADLAFDPAPGLPGIAYAGNSSNTLMFAHHDGVAWQTEPVHTPGSELMHVSLAFHPTSGLPSIAYQIGDNGSLAYAAHNGATWDFASPYPNGIEPDLAFDPSSGKAAMSCYDKTSRTLHYLEEGSPVWSAVEVDSNAARGRYNSIAIDPITGEPGISYYNDSLNNLRYAERSGASWSSMPVDTSGNRGHFTSLAYNPLTGLPAISYCDTANENLRYVEFDGTSWSVPVLVEAGDVPTRTSLAFDSTGTPYIAYGLGNDVRLAKRVGGVWGIEDVDIPGYQSFNPSVAINPVTDLPAVSFREGSPNVTPDLIYTKLPLPPVPEPTGLGLIGLAMLAVRRERT